MESTVTPLGGGVYEIDTRMAGYPGITAGYLILSDRPCLVEPGTAGSAPVVRRALDELGVGAADLATVVVTHIHLDHAGGVGDIAEMYPEAQVVVHEKGARHLASPERLMRSARMVYGSKLDTLFGELKPTEQARIHAVEETGVIDLGGGRRLESYYSPGHAKHHVGLLDSQTGDLYVGDAVGVYIPETKDLRPATPPPDFDLKTALGSLRKFRELGPQRLLFAHYGPVAEVDDTLERSAEELRAWVDMVKDARDAGLDLDHAVAMVRDRTRERYAFDWDAVDPGQTAKYEILEGTESNVQGIMHALDRQDR
ncbi:MBL fold metallo-hydrolase [Actinomadura sp. NBRC 104412]|uniref:MBL fold metallo-hydrolase n=1 Tax=Actinomadura sp. NBRC 104412 TaxID=3032203 RepID=UPI0024A02359|nr:MBL fold metallo-hydrolase [Actinomadura sp. NBRC 104412]GLZ06781.1 MBL fold metallo-hydrolase [Actinomadura sp. NBRC 104412]